MAGPTALILCTILGLFAAVLPGSNADDPIDPAIGGPTYGEIDGIDSTILKGWTGGFVGDIEFTAPHRITEWTIRIAFRKKVTSIETDGAIVVKGLRDGRSFLLRNTPCNGELDEGEKLSFFFKADNVRDLRGQKGAVIVNWKYVMCKSPCLNDGNCTAPDTCTCAYGWTGSLCETPICLQACQNGESCTAPNACTCDNGGTGSMGETDDCRYMIDNRGFIWDPSLSPLTFSIFQSDAASFVFERAQSSEQPQTLLREWYSSGGPPNSDPPTGYISWRDVMQNLLVDELHPAFIADDMEHAYSLSISSEGLVTLYEISDVDGTFIEPPIFTYQDDPAVVSIPLFVILRNSNSVPYIKFCNVQPKLLSHFKEASQSSVFPGANVAANAVDGFVTFLGGMPEALTADNNNGWWWRVNLGKEYIIKWVTIYPTAMGAVTVNTDDEILVGNCQHNLIQSGKRCGDLIDIVPLPIPFRPITRKCPEDIIGQFVQIMNANDPQLYPLSEVEVFGMDVNY